MNKILLFLFSVFIIGLFTGFYYKSTDEIIGNKILGFSVVFLVFIFMPIFLVYRIKGKKFEDYTLSDKNIKKMKERSEKN